MKTIELDEFGNTHVRTGIPMGVFECNHSECPAWRILTDPKGRAELYGAGDGISGVAVLWNSLDDQPPTTVALEVMQQLEGLRDAINTLLAKARNQEAA